MRGDRITVVFQGRRHRVLARTETVVSLEQHPVGPRVDVSVHDPDLILDPTSDDVELAVAFERGEISAFEYPDGHTYPPNREIGLRNRRNAMLRRVH
jgi:hypothetical protein